VYEGEVLGRKLNKRAQPLLGQPNFNPRIIGHGRVQSPVRRNTGNARPKISEPKYF
jgi:hypothetical protein